jgi:hypothetical protein
MAWRVLSIEMDREDLMLRVQIEKMGEMAVVGCDGRIVLTDAAFRLLDAVIRSATRESLWLIFRKCGL